MVDPKIFYRELDALLAQIGKQESNEYFFQSILQELLKRFGESLRIRSGFLYERRGEAFIRIHSENQGEKGHFARSLPFNAAAILELLKHGNYIYDQESLKKVFELNIDDYTVPAAISIRINERHWLLVFGLGHGWVREETQLFLNAVRTAVVYRLFSEMMTTEMNMAEQIQRSLLPQTGLDIPGFEMAHFSQPAESVGGDFYDFFETDDETFGISLGDASGHGLPAALLARDVVIGLRMGMNKHVRLVRTIRKLNRVIQRSTYSTNFVSLFLCEIEDTDQLFYVNAGHPPPFLMVGKKIRELDATGIILGFLPDVHWHRSHTTFDEGGILVIYSDGIIERERREEEQFGIKRLHRLVYQNRHLSAQDLVDCLYEAVFDFGKKKAWADDATLVVVKRKLLNGQDIV